jgi:hypothetical protein
MAESALPVWVSGVSAAKAGGLGVEAIFTGAWGALSYVLFTGKVFAKTHPVLGTIAAILAVGNAAALVRTATEA